MTDTEKKALALLQECGWGGAHLKRVWNPRYEALCRAIEAHEAFRQEVSDVISELSSEYTSMGSYYADKLRRFIIAKPDLVQEAIRELGKKPTSPSSDDLRAALAARGLKIVEVGHD